MVKGIMINVLILPKVYKALREWWARRKAENMLRKMGVPSLILAMLLLVTGAEATTNRDVMTTVRGGGNTGSDCTITPSTDNFTYICKAGPAGETYVSVVYDPDNETALVITPYHNYKGATDTYYTIGEDNGSGLGVLKDQTYTIRNVAGAVVSTTWPVHHPDTGDKIKFTISFTGGGSISTRLGLGVVPKRQ